MNVAEATAIIEKAIEEACNHLLFEENVAVEAGMIVKWSKDENGDYLIVPNRPMEFINLNFVATPSGVEFMEVAE